MKLIKPPEKYSTKEGKGKLGKGGGGKKRKGEGGNYRLRDSSKI